MCVCVCVCVCLCVCVCVCVCVVVVVVVVAVVCLLFLMGAMIHYELHVLYTVQRKSKCKIQRVTNFKSEINHTDMTNQSEMCSLY